MADALAVASAHPETRRPRYSCTLSAALDHAIVQVEAAEAMGDTGMARAWRKVLAELELRIPETRP